MFDTRCTLLNVSGESNILYVRFILQETVFQAKNFLPKKRKTTVVHSNSEKIRMKRLNECCGVKFL